ncbi:hypothetical protein [Planctomycetes bacterium Pan216]|uniref:hypothetical protein n=1 Tax=Kolteria novifilia TaxID=2527975 RepID=UPI0011A2B932
MLDALHRFHHDTRFCGMMSKAAPVIDQVRDSDHVENQLYRIRVVTAYSIDNGDPAEKASKRS